MAPSAQAVKGSTKLLGTQLLDAGLISADQLDLALREQGRLGTFLGETLVNLGFVSQEHLSSFLAQSTHSKVLGEEEWDPDPAAVRLVPYELARRFRALPLHQKDDILTVAVVDTYNVVAIDALERATGLHVEVVAASPQKIVDAIDRQYARGGQINDTVDQLLAKGVANFGDDSKAEGPMILLCNQIISMAIQTRATDIHIEPGEKVMRVRIRVDGILRQEVLMPKQLQAPVIARLKLMANMNVTEKRTPQDGRLTFKLDQSEVDLRVSTLPTAFGDSVVLRILDKSSITHDLAALGFSTRNQEIFEATIDRPHGIILVTGPTGSGKTTTLYTALGYIDAMVKSVFTLEDPIEYQLAMIRQTQVNADIGMTFPAGLRAILRQDPDVLLVGEIRDQETAELAIQAALTGHLVFSTLHTNDAVGSIPRLIDLGVEPFILASSLVAVLGQRLVRRICKDCKVEREHPELLLGDLGISTTDDLPRKLWKGEGCKACSYSGYHGRMGIHEVLSIDERFHDPIIKGPDMTRIAELGKEIGMKTMAEDGIEKALQGNTTIEEVLRVVGSVHG